VPSLGPVGDMTLPPSFLMLWRNGKPCDDFWTPISSWRQSLTGLVVHERRRRFNELMRKLADSWLNEGTTSCFLKTGLSKNYMARNARNRKRR
jgi:hypothetical protein